MTVDDKSVSGSLVVPTLRQNVSFLNIDFNTSSRQDILTALCELSASRSHSYIVTPNVDHIVMLDGLPDIEIRRRFADTYNRAVIRLCDSRILSALARLQGIILPVYPGSDLTAHLVSECFDEQVKVAIVGGTATSLMKLRALFPLPNFVQFVPPMGVLNNPNAIVEITDFLSAAQADFVLMAIGAPQSEIIADICQRDGRFGGVSLCIGASIEFLTGEKQRAPIWVQRVNLEWAYRLLTEPRRLWRRYLIRGPRILKILIQGGVR
jgi:N-acetylglucosaminyldiphosphoundecaprenol N-acetyl-beta-D-mannosaminyltransferase